jgi:hypothetical protein
VESKCKRHKETQDLFLKFGHPQRMSISPLRSSQRAGSLSTLILPSCHKDQLGSHYQSLQRELQYKPPGLHHNPWELPGNPSRLEDSIPKSNKCNKVVEVEGEVLLLECDTLKRAQIFSQEQESRVNLRERGGSSRNESKGSFSYLLNGL